MKVTAELKIYEVNQERVYDKQLRIYPHPTYNGYHEGYAVLEFEGKKIAVQYKELSDACFKCST